MKRTTYTILGVWIVLFALFLPFSYGLFPHLGIELTTAFSSTSEWIAENVFGVNIAVSPSTSDSAAQFVQALLLLLFSIPVGILLDRQKRFSKEQIKQFLHTSAAYILALYLLKYGVDKLFQFQFYAPEPNTLFTPLGMLSKDILFWSSMGTSASYNTFMGLFEVIPAILLLHHRTRLLGGLIALGVLINVFAINFGFDITVKLLSSYLMIVALFIVLPYLRILTVFFFSESGDFKKPTLRLHLNPKFRFVLKSLIVILIFAEVLFTYIQVGSFNGREMEKIAYHGSYELAEDDISILGHDAIHRIHIHSKGYFILEDQHGEFFDFPMWVGSDESIIIRQENTQILISETESSLAFIIHKNGKKKTVLAREIHLDSLPARDDSFHWTVDGMLE